MTCECYQVAKIDAMTATFVPLKELCEIAKRRFPNAQLEAVQAMREALKLARTRIETDVVAP
jgi:hypothetical protein